MKKKFWGYDCDQVDDLFISLEKEKARQLLDLKQEIKDCLRHNYELVQGIERIVQDIESNYGREQGERLDEIATELRALYNRARLHNQKMDKIASSLDLVLEPYTPNGKLPSSNLAEKGAGKLICAATDDADTSHAIPRVLVIDDDDTIRAVVKLMLEREGYEVVEATNGGEAVQMIEQASPPDIIILDLMLPYVNGLQVIKKIRRHPEWNRVPVIMLSANTSENEVVNLLKAGANDYVTKPFNPRELVARVNANIERLHNINPGRESSSGKDA